MKPKTRIAFFVLAVTTAAILIPGWITTPKAIRSEPPSLHAVSDGSQTTIAKARSGETVSVSSLFRSLRNRTIDEIRAEKSESSQRIDQGRWIERANRGQLSAVERETFNLLLARYHAAVLAEWERLDATP